jgi:hypothetical protein
MGNDPTTTIPGSPSGNLGLILTLTLLAAFLAPVAMRVFYRSLRPSAGTTIKAVAGGLGAAASVDIMLLMLQVGPLVAAILSGLAAVGFAGYAFPQVRGLVRAKASELRHRPPAVPKQPPDHATQH